jgi:hypothetical protein
VTTVLQVLGAWCVASVAVAVFFCGMVRLTRRDRLEYLQERCRYHAWVRDPRGGLSCARCEWVAGQRESVHSLEDDDA